mmetsp:Transcript_41537/g.90494  ORF Transcript_41537/g.90494 Transcript_41537/m.90494 type:complete len:171 (+) Transcript_41537:59-571(+)|eukprot:CAMPEP_0204264836 /NCGR_PEP_ID=MMETSP0468-20130131/9270_1 /ASSEMBLY_ACC=CAM_ASM_000383 /TAXON_ID=2969 /ORGANISM="Oxyrrhis marina" /LENGTH=170 /DNA_ID=CAMNT_0051239729 /DNA_START=59 /DNA_END=571 /DNA_ORIENTATION=+
MTVIADNVVAVAAVSPKAELVSHDENGQIQQTTAALVSEDVVMDTVKVVTAENDDVLMEQAAAPAADVPADAKQDAPKEASTPVRPAVTPRRGLMSSARRLLGSLSCRSRSRGPARDAQGDSEATTPRRLFADAEPSALDVVKEAVEAPKTAPVQEPAAVEAADELAGAI